MSNSPKRIGIISSVLLFLIPGILFWIHLNWTIPLLETVFKLSVYAAWLITGPFFLFFPIFMLTFFLMKRDAYTLDWKTVYERLRIKRVTKNDWLWIIFGLLVAFVVVGLIIIILVTLPLGIDISELKEISPIEAQQLIGNECYFIILLPILFSLTTLAKKFYGEAIFFQGRKYPLANMLG